MNNTRRKEIARAFSLIDDARSILETTCAEEREYFEGLSDKAQETAKGEAAQEAITQLESAVSALEDAGTACENLTASTD